MHNIDTIFHFQEAHTLMIYTNSRGEIILFLVTKRKIPAEFNPIEVTFDDSNHGKMAVMNNVIVVEVGQSQKAWCSSTITSFFTKTCLFEVPPLSTICNYDKARGHLDVCVKTQIEASGRVPLETAAEISKHTQANDLFINAAFQNNLRKCATRFTINQLLEAQVVDERQANTTEDDESCQGEFEEQVESGQVEQEQPPDDGSGEVTTVGTVDTVAATKASAVLKVPCREETGRLDETELSVGFSTELSGDIVGACDSAGAGNMSTAGTTHVSALLDESADLFTPGGTTSHGVGQPSDISGVDIQDVDELVPVQAPKLVDSHSLPTITAGRGLSNLSLENQVDIIAEAASMITYRQILGSYERSGMSLPTDGSEDHKLSSGLKEVLRKAGQIIVPTAESEQAAIEDKRQVAVMDEEEDDIFDLSKLFKERRNLVMRKQVIDDSKSTKKLKVKGTDKSFKCSYCGKVYASYYSAAAKSHDFERGGACPKESLESDGISVPSRNELLCQKMFFRSMEFVSTKVVDIDEEDEENVEYDDNLPPIDDEFVKEVKTWKFVLSNLSGARRKSVMRFIKGLKTQGIVKKVDRSVTHIIMGSDSSLRAPRTKEYIMGVASGRLIVSDLWVEACVADLKNVVKAKQFEVCDEELGGAKGPWLSRIARLSSKPGLLKGFEVLIADQLDSIDDESVRTILKWTGATIVENVEEFSADKNNLILVNKVGANHGDEAQEYLIVDKTWLWDSIGGYEVVPTPSPSYLPSLPVSSRSISAEDDVVTSAETARSLFDIDEPGESGGALVHMGSIKSGSSGSCISYDALVNPLKPIHTYSRVSRKPVVITNPTMTFSRILRLIMLGPV